MTLSCPRTQACWEAQGVQPELSLSHLTVRALASQLFTVTVAGPPLQPLPVDGTVLNQKPEDKSGLSDYKYGPGASIPQSTEILEP